MDNQGGRQATADKHGIEVMKQILLPSISKDMKKVPKLLKESAGKSSCCIFRVPQALARGNAEACWPRVISIGPYHHGEPQLQMFEEHKWRYLRAMLDRIQPHGIDLENLIDVVAPKEEIIRQCYSESTDIFSGPDLMKMMILDGCFIIELLRQIGGVLSPDPDEPLLKISCLLDSLELDLLRLGNQVPYFVLEKLFETTNVPKGVTPGLADLALGYFNRVLVRSAHSWGTNSNVGVNFFYSIHLSNLKGVHLLDLIRLNSIPWDLQDNNLADESSTCTLIDSAYELHRKGIKFRQRRSGSFLEIKFDVKSNTIEIPALIINDTYNCILLNMVAFEQCYGHCDKHVTAYAMFMGCLLQTAKDAQFLHDQGVFRNYGVSKEDVARFFGGVCKDASFDIERSYLASAYGRVNEYSRNDILGIWLAEFVHKYFSDPLSLITYVGTSLSLASLVQTVYAVLQYYHPKK